MQVFKIITLVDITRTIPTRDEPDRKKINQQANFDSLIQTIGLRSIIDWNIDPVMSTGTLPVVNRGKASHWIWEFETEQTDLFLDADGPTGLLTKDLHGVPIITGLDDSADLTPPAFITLGRYPNTWIYLKPGC